MKNAYTHALISEIHQFNASPSAEISIAEGTAYTESLATEIMLESMKLAQRIGVFPQFPTLSTDSPYQYLVFDAPLLSGVVNTPIYFLRGWSAFDSCVKGFNAMGLMADQVKHELQRIEELSTSALLQLKKKFLLSRKDQLSKPFWTKKEVGELKEDQLKTISTYDLAVWQSFAQRPVVCSTSSNMGISCHQALRLMQDTFIEFGGKKLPLLNKDEGRLIIWAPDPRADFMNEEKTFLLQQLEKEQPALTTITTYVNRQQRDPGALRDALLTGGYFFPTNPQSKEELQNLLFISFEQLQKERQQTLAELIADPLIQQTLASLHCKVLADKIEVHLGIESGLYGLMIPYFVMIEEVLVRYQVKQVNTWNQASIGAALAAAVYADRVLRHFSALSKSEQQTFEKYFPLTVKYMQQHSIGRDLRTEVHGVFDIANLQSLAQLLEVTVKNHLSGRATAYVGLGSSSYSNGNRCFEILKQSMEENGSFKGKSTFHPTTHTLTPFAQALIFGEEVYRFLVLQPESANDKEVDLHQMKQFVHKPEPAGAASVSGYLLTQLDAGELSVFELAYALQLVGFSSERFLHFHGYKDAEEGKHLFTQLAFEEGELMGNFAQTMLVLLDWPAEKLQQLMNEEKQKSLSKKKPDFSHGTCLYLTGDNCFQPSDELLLEVARYTAQNRDRIKQYSELYIDLSNKK